MDVYVRIRVIPGRVESALKEMEKVEGVLRVDRPAEPLDILAYAQIGAYQEMSALIRRISGIKGIDQSYRFPLDFGEIKGGRQVPWPGIPDEDPQSSPIRAGKLDGFPWGLTWGYLFYSDAYQDWRLAPKPGVKGYSGRGAIPQSAFQALRAGRAYHCIAEFGICSMWFIVGADDKKTAQKVAERAAQLEIREPGGGSTRFQQAKEVSVDLIRDKPGHSGDHYDVEYMEMMLMMGEMYYFEEVPAFDKLVQDTAKRMELKMKITGGSWRDTVLFDPVGSQILDPKSPPEHPKSSEPPPDALDMNEMIIRAAAAIRGVPTPDPMSKVFPLKEAAKRGSPQGVRQLVDSIRAHESDGAYVAFALDGLTESTEREVLDLRLRLLDHPDGRVRLSAAASFVQRPDKRAVDQLRKLLNDGHSLVRTNAALALAQYGDKKSRKAIQELFERETNMAGKEALRQALEKLKR